MRSGNNLLQHAQERWRNRVIQRRYARVITIDRIQILGRIVRTDTEEIDLIAEVVDDVTHRRHFHHDTQSNRLCMTQAIALKLNDRFLDHALHP